ncbi:hypothetical protein [Qipengyuania sp. NPDC077563]|uniref:hypothetical protein n=1 Tax=Qipengyuania sp. NPDC077563 TaxID=3364497 RepID=UPI00384F8C4F
MSSKRLETLRDFARHGYKIRIDCACGRVVLVDPHQMLLALQEKGEDRISLERLATKLKCYRCGSRPRRIGP